MHNTRQLILFGVYFHLTMYRVDLRSLWQAASSFSLTAAWIPLYGENILHSTNPLVMGFFQLPVLPVHTSFHTLECVLSINSWEWKCCLMISQGHMAFRSLFNHSPFVEHLGCFQLVALLNKFAMNRINPLWTLLHPSQTPWAMC